MDDETPHSAQSDDAGPRSERPASPAPHTHAEPRVLRVVQRALAASRYIILIPVVLSILMALVTFIFGTNGLVGIIVTGDDRGDPAVSTPVTGAVPGTAAEHKEEHVTAAIIRALDTYLVAAFLLIFAFGMYELFIGRLPTVDEGSVFHVRDFDDLKSRLGKVALLVLIVEFVNQALAFHYTRGTDLLILAGGVVLIALALAITNYHGQSSR